MRMIIATVLALGIVTAAAAPTFAFDSKTFWQTRVAGN